MRRLRYLATGVVIAGLFYLILIDTTDLPEIYALVAVVLLSSIAFAVSVGQGLTEASFQWSWLGRVWRAMARVPLDVVLVVRQALAQLFVPSQERGELRAIPFKSGEEPLDVGRSALTEIFGSFAPNTIVIGIDAEREMLLVHQLRRHGKPDELDVLRLG